MCGFDGRLGRNPVAIEAAHVRWHSQHGPDDLANAVALCSLHHALFDCGVLGPSPGLKITVSPLYVATSQAGRAIDALAGSRYCTYGRVSHPSVSSMSTGTQSRSSKATATMPHKNEDQPAA
jgi:putative restriction endonuclease